MASRRRPRSNRTNGPQRLVGTRYIASGKEDGMSLQEASHYAVPTNCGDFDASALFWVGVLKPAYPPAACSCVGAGAISVSTSGGSGVYVAVGGAGSAGAGASSVNRLRSSVSGVAVAMTTGASTSGAGVAVMKTGS